MTIEEFESGLMDNVTLVDFGAAWCGPCRQMEPVIKDLEEKYRDKARIMAVDIDSQRMLATHYMVQSIPTLILFDKGSEITRFVGLQSRETLERYLDDILSRHTQ